MENQPTLPKALGKLAIIPGRLHLSPPTFKLHGEVHGVNDGASTSRSPDPISRPPSPSPARRDPEEYADAKKKLKRAVLEFYR